MVLHLKIWRVTETAYMSIFRSLSHHMFGNVHSSGTVLQESDEDEYGAVTGKSGKLQCNRSLQNRLTCQLNSKQRLCLQEQ